MKRLESAVSRAKSFLSESVGIPSAVQKIASWKQQKVQFGDWMEGKTKDGMSIQMKVFEDPSDYGIDGGQISILDLRKDGKILANYSRGWDVKPSKGSPAYKVIRNLVDGFGKFVDPADINPDNNL